MQDQNLSRSSSSVYDFDNALDISTGKKQKTGQAFKQQGFDFEDFRNIGDDKTLVSDKTSKKWTNSDLMKKSFDSNLVLSDNNTQQDIDFRSKNEFEISASNFRSPKFVEFDERQQARTQNEFTLRQTKMREPPQSEYKVKPKYRPSDMEKVNFYAEKDPALKDVEQYQFLCDQISFYSKATESLLFQQRRVREGSEDIILRLSNHMKSIEAQGSTDQIAIINGEIQHEKSIQRKLNNVRQELQEDYEQLVKSIVTMSFGRPTVMTAQTKALLEEINGLKAQFESVYRDEASLNLSLTVPPQKYSDYQTSKFMTKQSQPLAMRAEAVESYEFTNAFGLIFEEEKVSEDPKLLYNLKMACLKEDWILFNNCLLQVHVSYRLTGVIKVSIGNKNAMDLVKFGLAENSSIIVEGEVLAGRSYYAHLILTTKYQNRVPFIPFTIKYSVKLGSETLESREVKIFIPNMCLKLGQFIPFTRKELQNEKRVELPQIVGLYRPMDKSIIGSLTEISIYLPNLLFAKDNSDCYGIFRMQDRSGALVNIKEKDQLIRFQIKNCGPELLKVLQFIFTV